MTCYISHLFKLSNLEEFLKCAGEEKQLQWPCSPLSWSFQHFHPSSFLPRWNVLILHVQKWLVKTRTCRADSSCGELYMSRAATSYTLWWIMVFVAMSSLWISKFWIISCQVVEGWCILDWDEQEHLQMNLIQTNTFYAIGRKGLNSIILFICWARPCSHIQNFRTWVA